MAGPPSDQVGDLETRNRTPPAVTLPGGDGARPPEFVRAHLRDLAKTSLPWPDAPRFFTKRSRKSLNGGDCPALERKGGRAIHYRPLSEGLPNEHNQLPNRGYASLVRDSAMEGERSAQERGSGWDVRQERLHGRRPNAVQQFLIRLIAQFDPRSPAHTKTFTFENLCVRGASSTGQTVEGKGERWGECGSVGV